MQVVDLQTFSEAGGKSGGRKERRQYMFVTFNSFDSVNKCMENTNHQIGHAKVSFENRFIRGKEGGVSFYQKTCILILFLR